MKEIESKYKKYYDDGVEIKALVVINPGNPTGNVLDKNNILDCLNFCKNNNLIIVADEV